MYVDCPTCGQPEHESKFRKCGRCGQFICAWCRDNTHECHDVCSKKKDEQGRLGMRPYRGITKDGRLVCGWYIKLGLHHLIADETMDWDSYEEGVVEIEGLIEVIPETVGQLTGLNDKNGKEIYEGDKDRQGGIVTWSKDEAAFVVEYKNVEAQDMLEVGDWFEVVGNIHQNPELLKD